MANSNSQLEGSNPIKISDEWTAFPDSASNRAEIANDVKSFKALMIVGNRSGAPEGTPAATGRAVTIYDQLTVSSNSQGIGQLFQAAYRGAVSMRGADLTISGLPDAGTGTEVRVDSNGKITREVSSARFKQDVQPLEDDFAKIFALEPKSFAYKESGRKSFGYLAEDLDGAGLKNLVVYDEDNQPWAIHYNKIIIYLLEIIKRDHAKLEELAAAVERLSAPTVT